MKYTKAIGLRLEELLKQKKFTQTQLAAKSKISPTNFRPFL